MKLSLVIKEQSKDFYFIFLTSGTFSFNNFFLFGMVLNHRYYRVEEALTIGLTLRFFVAQSENRNFPIRIFLHIQLLFVDDTRPQNFKLPLFFVQGLVIFSDIPSGG